jgi:DNA-binding CsgD family transcriptional regulator/PAS domain-containing protein
MREMEQLSTLIGGIYDAAIDAALWPAVLANCASFIGGSAAALFSKDAASKTGDVAYQTGIEPYYQHLYFKKYIKLDPLTVGHYFAEIEKPVAIADILPYDEFLETRAYREWGEPQGIVDVLNVALDKTTTSAAMFCVFRHKRSGLVDDEMRRRMALLVPHIRRAVLIGRVINLKKAEAASLADTLDGISAGVFLVDATGRIVHANVAGHVMLGAADVLHAVGGRLEVNDPQADQVLADTFSTAGNGDAAVGTKGVAVPLVARDGAPYVAHVLPLTSGARRRAGTSYAAVAALLVHKASLDVPSPPEAIAKAYKLTPMELRVLLAIVEVGGVPDVAEALGIAETTVKTHLGRLYEKVNASRQADLVKIVAGFSNPLAGSARTRAHRPPAGSG